MITIPTKQYKMVRPDWPNSKLQFDIMRAIRHHVVSVLAIVDPVDQGYVRDHTLQI